MSALRRLPGVRDLTLVTAGAMTANAAGYLLQLLAGRWLGVAGYSEFASLLAVQLLAAVPALALQNVVARELVRGAAVAAVRGLGRRSAVVVAVVAVVLIPVVSAVLQVGSVAAAGALVAAPAQVLLSGEQGILQGARRFRALAVVLGGAGLARVAPALLALAFGAGSGGALWAAALGLFVAALAARIGARTLPLAADRADPAVGDIGDRVPGSVLVPGSPRAHMERIPAGTGDEAVGGGHDPVAPGGGRAPHRVLERMRIPEGGAAVLRAAQVQAALMALSSADLIVARIVLNDADASRYALGAIATKIAFWLPQAVGVVLYPRMAQPQYSARAIRDALGVLLAVGIAAVAGAAMLAPLAPVFAGHDYAPIEGWLWLFALDGALLALLQGALLSAIAVDRTAPTAITWVGLAVEVIVIGLFARSLPVLIGTATGVVAVVAAAIIVIVLRAAARGAGDRPSA
ncbi:hypothetical protein ABIA39_002717 [Nocardia sp. GAS34]|uniref:polysaccharide biosynthesis protein n=1 Tax=unclassified Nocardia TaxID=2637762 RepID=UPI003D1E13DC